MNKYPRTLFKYMCVISLGFCILSSAVNAKVGSIKPAISSFDTGYTITKVRTGNKTSIDSAALVYASTYEGIVLAINLKGEIVWQNNLSGFMNHDIWVADINGDKFDDLLAANADGNVYAINSNGELLWKFEPGKTEIRPPMYSVTVIFKNEKPLIVAGGYDKNLFYIDSKGKLLEKIPSSDYSIAKAYFKRTSSYDEKGAREPFQKQHITNFLRPFIDKDGTQKLVVHAANNSMQTPGSLYVFDYMSKTPSYSSRLEVNRAPIGELKVVDLDNDGVNEIILGSTKIKQNGLTIFNPSTNEQSGFSLHSIHKKMGEFGYRIAQPEVITYKGKPSILVLYGEHLAVFPITTKKPESVELFTSHYSYNDMWKMPKQNKIILASAQSGGSSIHIIDLNNRHWPEVFENLQPSGKIAKLISNAETLKRQVNAHTPEDVNKSVYLMSDLRKADKRVVKRLRDNFDSPIFLEYGSLGSEDYDRSVISNEAYRNKKDGRQKYAQSQKEILRKAEKMYQGDYGASYWGGHGNDPHFRSFDTHKKTLDIAAGKKTVMIFPELAHYNVDFVEMLNDFIYPLAEYSQKKNTRIFLRNKHTFWQSQIYKPAWSRLISGEFADVFIPAMEETTDKSMELSIASRMGLWASGSVDSWGARFSRDNTSFDRLRQHSHQMLANHALRQFVYNISYGARYINNFAYNSQYMEILWEMIAKGIIYVPDPKNILSFSPVHLSILPPDGHYLDEGNNVKWVNAYDPEVEEKNKLVFSRLNGSWPGSPVSEYDFSRYAAGVKDRRLNFLPQYENGVVLMTPPQAGAYADLDAPRGKLIDRLNPLYHGETKEFYTNGRDYFSADGKQIYSPDQYYKVLEESIKEKSALLPITVDGDVAWVNTQIAPKKMRLTLIDNGYINPDDRTVLIKINPQLNVSSIVDVLSGEEIKIEKSKSSVMIPAGFFRFFDITVK